MSTNTQAHEAAVREKVRLGKNSDLLECTFAHIDSAISAFAEVPVVSSGVDGYHLYHRLLKERETMRTICNAAQDAYIAAHDEAERLHAVVAHEELRDANGKLTLDLTVLPRNA